MESRLPDSIPPLPSFWRSLHDGLALIRPLLRARGEWRGGLLLAVVVALTLGTVWINVRFSSWNNRFYDTLQNHDLAGFWRQLEVFCALALAYIAVAVYRQYLQQMLFMRWRNGMVAWLLERWLQPGTAYRLGADGEYRIDNPDQRIAEDARGFVSASLELSLGLLNSCVTLVSFIGILWGLSGVLKIHFGPVSEIPGYMVWVALVYALAGTWITNRLGHPLVGLNAQQQRVEADFRYALVQVRDHAEAISLARGESMESIGLQVRFGAIRANWSALIRATKRLTWFSAGYGQMANVFPILAAAPRYFSGTLLLGGLMQTAQAFGQVQGALSWFIDAYPSLADWRATVNRLTAFVAATERDALEDPSASAECDWRNGLSRQFHAQDFIEWSALSVSLGNGRRKLWLPPHTLRKGERLLIAGPSGGGKSTLIRAIAGLWREGAGTVTLPGNATLMFVPQQPYLSEGSLREALAYPEPGRRFDRQALEAALTQAGLAALTDQLDRPRRWAGILSPGEQQRLHFARVLLHRPDWVFLDEATSALDECAERKLYQALVRSCPSTTIVSVGHRSTLREFHEQIWNMGEVAEMRETRIAQADEKWLIRVASDDGSMIQAVSMNQGPDPGLTAA